MNMKKLLFFVAATIWATQVFSATTYTEAVKEAALAATANRAIHM